MTGFVAFCIVCWFGITAVLMYLDVRAEAEHESTLEELWSDEA